MINLLDRIYDIYKYLHNIMRNIPNFKKGEYVKYRDDILIYQYRVDETWTRCHYPSGWKHVCITNDIKKLKLSSLQKEEIDLLFIGYRGER